MNVLIWYDYLKKGLKEDGWPWDWTTRGSVSDSKKLKAKVISRSNGVWAASGLCTAVEKLSEEMGSPIKVLCKIKDGQKLKKNSSLCQWQGPASSVLALERHFLNLASYASGIATATRDLVDLVEKKQKRFPPRIVATRKILPNYRDLAIHSVIAGGGYSHRVGVSGGVLIKENHISANGSITQAIKAARLSAPHGLQIEVEVQSLEELKKALGTQVDAVLLDNFTIEKLRSALKLIKKGNHKIKVEISGGINTSNIQKYALSGVDIISVGAITHSVKSLNFSMLMT